MINDAQVVLLSLAVLIIGVVVRRFRQGRIGTLAFFLWFLLWASAAVVILFPNSTVVVARYVGIGRGADLVLYLGAILILYLIFRMFVRLEQMDRNMTKIVRTLALREAGLAESDNETGHAGPLPGENQRGKPISPS
jgi:small membrane protein